MSKVRIVAAALTLSALGFIAIVSDEGYTSTAIIPTKGDRPTHGFGSTFNEDGSPVRVGDKTDPVRALRTAQAHISREENRFRNSIPVVRLTQGEYDLYMDFIYQYGSGTWANSGMRRKLLAGDYRGACAALLRYRFAGGYDCATIVNGKRNKRCWGVWERQLKRHQTCMGEQA